MKRALSILALISSPVWGQDNPNAATELPAEESMFVEGEIEATTKPEDVVPPQSEQARLKEIQSGQVLQLNLKNLTKRNQRSLQMAESSESLIHHPDSIHAYQISGQEYSVFEKTSDGSYRNLTSYIIPASQGRDFSKVLFDPTGHVAYVIGKVQSAIGASIDVLFPARVDARTGALQLQDPQSNFVPSQIVALQTDAQRKFLYAFGEDHSYAIFRVNEADAMPVFLDILSGDRKNTKSFRAATMQFSPDNKRLFVIDKGLQGFQVSLYQRDPMNGRLIFDQRIKNVLAAAPQAIEVLEDGKKLTFKGEGYQLDVFENPKTKIFEPTDQRSSLDAKSSANLVQ